MKPALTYDDIQLIPQYSDIQSRSSVSLRSRLSRNFELIVPYIASPMDTICETEMAKKMMNLGGVGCIHRFMSIEEQSQMVKDVQIHAYHNEDLESVWGDLRKPIMAAIGANGDYLERAERLVESGANVILIDVAHGHHKNVKDAIEALIHFREQTGQHFDIIAGNIATARGAKDLEDWGADGVRVGIGGGCFTPDMKVRTKDGLRSIVDVQIGDMVYTHTGELKPIINKFEYDNNEDVIQINDIKATPTHKFYVVHASNLDFIDDNTIHNYAEWVSAEDLTDEYYLVELE